jgi:hypothetical protein
LEALIDGYLLDAINARIERIVGPPTDSKVATAIHAVTKAWLDVKDSPAPFAFDGDALVVVEGNRRKQSFHCHRQKKWIRMNPPRGQFQCKCLWCSPLAGNDMYLTQAS